MISLKQQQCWLLVLLVYLNATECRSQNQNELDDVLPQNSDSTDTKRNEEPVFSGQDWFEPDDNSVNSFEGLGEIDESHKSKRSPPISIGSRGFHPNIFTQDFGGFYPYKRNARNADSFEKYDTKTPNSWKSKRRFGMDASGFHGDTFNDGWGTFSTMKKRRPEMDASGFFGDTFSNGFGDFYTMKKRRPEMTASGFHGDTFSNGFGDFYTMKKRLENELKLRDLVAILNRSRDIGKDSQPMQ